MIDWLVHRFDCLIFLGIGVLLLLKPLLMHKFSMSSLRWKKKFFKGTNMERFTNKAYESTKKDPHGSVILARFMGIILLLFALIMLRV
ncbi:MAG: hypothetical protein ACREHC_00125 [Candidatus Levyibacteriota bacterium]